MKVFFKWFLLSDFFCLILAEWAELLTKRKKQKRQRQCGHSSHGWAVGHQAMLQKQQGGQLKEKAAESFKRAVRVKTKVVRGLRVDGELGLKMDRSCKEPEFSALVAGRVAERHNGLKSWGSYYLSLPRNFSVKWPNLWELRTVTVVNQVSYLNSYRFCHLSHCYPADQTISIWTLKNTSYPNIANGPGDLRCHLGPKCWRMGVNCTHFIFPIWLSGNLADFPPAENHWHRKWIPTEMC